MRDYPALGESDQAPGEVRLLWPGCQPDGYPAGSGMVDDAALGISHRDAIVNQALVQSQVSC
jgi:hypothetical protein